MDTEDLPAGLIQPGIDPGALSGSGRLGLLYG